MINWHESDEARAFILTGDTRETSVEVMQAIAFFADNLAEAESIWHGDFLGKTDDLALWEKASNNGLIADEKLFWGTAGNRWKNWL
jgi:hypothetical protein